MSPEPARRRTMLRRALAPARRLADVRDLARAAGSAVLKRRPVDAFALVHGTLRDAADLVASRLLALDDDASALALFVEQTTRGRDVADLMGTMLRRNLLLDGTFMAIIEPLVSEGALPDALDDATLDRATITLTRLLAELAGIDADTEHTQPLEALAALAETPMDGVLAHLRGDTPAEARTRFVALSYVLFLESWLLRATVDRIGALTSEAAPTATVIDSTQDPQ